MHCVITEDKKPDTDSSNTFIDALYTVVRIAIPNTGLVEKTVKALERHMPSNTFHVDVTELGTSLRAQKCFCRIVKAAPEKMAIRFLVLVGTDTSIKCHSFLLY